MALNVDQSKALRTPRQREELVRAVLTADPSEESRHVEWKSSLDDLTSVHGSATVARAILGMANRSLTVANTAFGGAGYVVVGAEPGNLVGQLMPDLAKLVPAVERYTGRGVEWDAHLVSVGETSVVVFSVEPPRPGDRIATLQKSYQLDGEKQVEEGTIFVRFPGRTDRARKEDIDALQDRLVAGGKTVPDVAVELDWVRGAPRVLRMDIGPDAIGAWAADAKEKLEGATPSIPPRGFGALSLSGITPRAIQRYEAEVAKFLREMPEKLPDIVRWWLVNGALDKLGWVLAIGNPGEETLSGIELTLRLPVGLEAYVETPPMDAPPVPEFKPESPFGSLAVPDLSILRGDRLPELVAVHDAFIEVRDDGWIVHYSKRELHAGRSVEFDPIVLITGAPDGTEFSVEMTVTASNRRGQYRKVFSATASGWAPAPLDVLPLEPADDDEEE